MDLITHNGIGDISIPNGMWDFWFVLLLNATFGFKCGWFALIAVRGLPRSVPRQRCEE